MNTRGNHRREKTIARKYVSRVIGSLDHGPLDLVDLEGRA